jgi:DNA-binding response OmpR family regulator
MARSLAGKRILVVEDEYFIASDLKQALEAAEARVIGPVATLGAALLLAEAEQLDAAILDVNLEGDFSFPLAEQLTQKGVPYLLLTGYDGWALPDKYRDVPRVAKPFAPSAVVSSIEGLVAAEEAV